MVTVDVTVSCIMPAYITGGKNYHLFSGANDFFRDFIFNKKKSKITISVLPGTLMWELLIHDNKDMLVDRMNVNEKICHLLYHCQWQREMKLISLSLTMWVEFVRIPPTGLPKGFSTGLP